MGRSGSKTSRAKFGESDWRAAIARALGGRARHYLRWIPSVLMESPGDERMHRPEALIGDEETRPCHHGQEQEHERTTDEMSAYWAWQDEDIVFLPEEEEEEVAEPAPAYGQCTECGAYISLELISGGSEPSDTAPCGHRWFSYQHTGQSVLQ
jgi:hypothetical protein